MSANSLHWAVVVGIDRYPGCALMADQEVGFLSGHRPDTNNPVAMAGQRHPAIVGEDGPDDGCPVAGQCRPLAGVEVEEHRAAQGTPQASRLTLPRIEYQQPPAIGAGAEMTDVPFHEELVLAALNIPGQDTL